MNTKISMKSIWIVVFDGCNCVTGEMDKKNLPQFCKKHGNQWLHRARMSIGEPLASSIITGLDYNPEVYEAVYNKDGINSPGTP